MKMIAECEKSQLEVAKERLQAISSAFDFHHSFRPIEILNDVIVEESESENSDEESGNEDSTKKDANTNSDDDEPETDKAVISKHGIANKVCIHNFNTLKCMRGRPKFEVARKYNTKALNIVPDNFNALWNKVYIMISANDSLEDDMQTEAENILHQLETVITKDKKLMLIAKAEVAGMHAFLPGYLKIFLSSVALYEEVLDELQEFSKQSLSDIENLILIWKQDLVQNYARLTYGHKHERAIAVASDIVKELDHHPAITDKDKARLWVNLAVISQHCIPRYERNFGYSNTELLEFPTSEHCYRKAMRYDPQNPRIFMQAGREQRKRAKTVPGLEEAVEWLEKAMEGEGMETDKEYLLHHIGLANQSLWQLTDNPEYRNIEDDYKFRRNSHDDDGSRLGSRVIKPPNHPLDFSKIPPPYKKLHKSTQWRFFNPIVHDIRNKYYLRAIQCFEEAIRITSDKCLYLTHLARLRSSALDLVKAGECLREAEKEVFSDIVSAESVGVSLYEYIGFHEETLMMQKGFNHNHAEKIKSSYRESIRQSTRSNWKPVVAFHHLLRILYKQLEDEDGFDCERDRMIVQDEYFLLYMAIQESKDPRDILKTLTTSDFKIDLISRLIQAFHERNEEFDAEAGFAYFSVLAVFRKKPKLEIGAENNAGEIMRILLKLAERVARQRIEQPRYLRQEYRILYELIGEEARLRELNSSSLESELAKLELYKMKIVMAIICPMMLTGCVRSIEQC